jgi:two-component system sensor histidine kinase RstB
VVVEQTGPHAARVLRWSARKTCCWWPRSADQRATGARHDLSAGRRTGALPGGRTAERLAQIKQSKGFGFDIALHGRAGRLDDDQRRRVEEGDTVMALGKDGDSIRVFAGMVGSPWVLEIGPLYQMNPYPPQLLILIAFLGLCLIGLIVYLLVRQLERRVRAWKPPPRASPRAAWKPACRPAAPTRSGAWPRPSMAWPSTCSVAGHPARAGARGVPRAAHAGGAPALRPGDDRLATTEQALEKYLEGMDGDIQDLDKLVDEMLTYARLEQGAPALKFQRIDLDALAQSGDRGAGAAACRGHGAARVCRGRCRRRLGRGRAALPAPRAAEPGEQCHAPCRVEVR